MDSGERPFPCKLDGCRLSFTTEDHLNAHRKKHDMLLNLELPNKSNLFADQTPTPTRLIGKCEEVGLFDDLQRVNPFEETFRRAVEKSSGSGESSSEKTESSTLGPVGTGDETLHTPHVFPLLERRDSHKLSKLIISRSNSRKDDDAISQTVPIPDNRQSTKRKQKHLHNSSNKKPLVRVLPKATPTTQPVIIISCEKKETLPSIKPSSPLHPVKAKLKKYLARNGHLAETTTGEAKQTTTVRATVVNASSLSSQKVVERDDVPQNKPKERVQEESTDQKHERWKMAAKRYRTRVKQNQDKLHKKTLELEEENLRLKTELARMQHMLSLHKDCSVTRALQAGTIVSTSTGAAGPSSTAKAVLVPMVVGGHQPQQQQQLIVQPGVEVVPCSTPALKPVLPTAGTSGNPVYIILGNINTVSELAKPI